jgi:hypothetical protein
MKGFLFICLLCLALGSCSKENSDVFTITPGNPINDTAWSNQVASNDPAVRLHTFLTTAPVVDSFNATSTSILHLSNILDITVPGNSCTYRNGSPVTGKIKLEVQHLVSNGDFIRYGRPTTSYGKILDCGGAFNIRAFKGNDELILQTGKQVVLTIRDHAPANNMRVFVELLNPQQPLPAGTNPFYTWVQAADSSRITTFTKQDSTGVTKGYNLFSRRLNWINFQSFIDSTQAKSNLTATLPGNFTNKNTAVYAVFKNKKRVVQLNADFSNRAFSAPNIPFGSNVVLVSVSLIGEQLYLGVKEFTVNNVPITTINPVVKSVAEINSFLKSL